MTQAPLFLAVYLVGLAIALAIGPRRHVAMCCALAFPVGLAAAVLTALLILVLGIPYSAWTLGGALLIEIVALAIARRPGRPARADLVTGVAWTVAFALASVLISRWNLSRMNFDAHHMVMLGRIIGHDGALEPRTMEGLQLWGVFQMTVQSMSAFTRQDYLYAVQPVLGASFLGVFVLALWRVTGHLGATGWLRAAGVAAVTIALFTLYVFAHHLVFLHTNLGTAVYLFGFVVLFWIAEREDDLTYLPIAFLCLTALAIQRLETPLLALIAMVATLTTTTLPRRAVTLGLAAFTAAIAGWYFLLSFHVSPESRFLNPTRCYLVAGLLVGYLAWWIASAHPRLVPLERRLHVIVAIVFVLGLAGTFALATDHMMISLDNWTSVLFTLPHWGQAWYLITAAVVIAVLIPAPPRSRAFTLTIALALVYTMILAYARIPYRYALLDSANRMTIHVLPLLFFYLGIKAIPAATRP